MDIDRLIHGLGSELEKQDRREMEAASKRFQDTLEIQREQFRRAQNIADAAESSLMAADNAAAEIAWEIGEFEREIQPNEEARLCIVGGPAGILIFPETIEPIRPDKLIFTGRDQTGSLVRAIQHVSQLNIVLKAVTVPKGRTPQRTGFHHPIAESDSE